MHVEGPRLVVARPEQRAPVVQNDVDPGRAARERIQVRVGDALVRAHRRHVGEQHGDARRPLLRPRSSVDAATAEAIEIATPALMTPAPTALIRAAEICSALAPLAARAADTAAWIAASFRATWRSPCSDPLAPCSAHFLLAEREGSAIQ